MVLKPKRSYGRMRTITNGTFQLPPELILELDLREGAKFMLIDANPPQMWLGRYLLVPTEDDVQDDVLEVVEMGVGGTIQVSEKNYRKIGLFRDKSLAVIRTEENLLLLDLWMDRLGDSITGRV